MDQTKRTVEVVGFKLAPWEMDGKRGITAELYRRVPLDSRKNGSDRALKGFTAAAVKVAPELLQRIAHLTPPFSCELTEEELSNGKTTQQVVVDLRPIELVKPKTPT
jgi:hypothetical protein